MRRNQMGRWLTTASTALTFFLATTANAQVPPKLVPRSRVQAKAMPSVEAKTAQQLRSYSIKYASVNAMMPAIQTLFHDTTQMRVLPDERTNMLIALGTVKAHEQLSELIKAVDVANQDLPQVKVFPLRQSTVKDSARVLDLLGVDVEIAVTEDSLVVRGGEQAIEHTSQILSLLNQAAESATTKQPPAPAEDVTIEIQWLAEGEMGDYPTLKGPIAAWMKDQGFGPVSELGSLQIASAVGGRVVATGAVFSGTLEALVEIDRGEIEGRRSVQVELEGKLGEFPVRLSTSFHAPLNQWVVLGVAAASGWTSESKEPPRNAFLFRLKPLMTIDVK